MSAGSYLISHPCLLFLYTASPQSRKFRPGSCPARQMQKEDTRFAVVQRTGGPSNFGWPSAHEKAHPLRSA